MGSNPVAKDIAMGGIAPAAAASAATEMVSHFRIHILLLALVSDSRKSKKPPGM